MLALTAWSVKMVRYPMSLTRPRFAEIGAMATESAWRLAGER
jgi:hypothetical protein